MLKNVTRVNIIQISLKKKRNKGEKEENWVKKSEIFPALKKYHSGKRMEKKYKFFICKYYIS